MQRIGLIGGVSWAATEIYYRLLNQEIQRALGGNHSADLVIRSLDLQSLLDRVDDVDAIEQIFAETKRELERAGADILAIASLTGHRYARPLRTGTKPFVDLLDIVCEELATRGVERVGILATSYALRDEKLMGRLQGASATQFIGQPAQWDAVVDRIIFGELAHGRLTNEGRDQLTQLIEVFKAQGAEQLLLATTDFSHIAPVLHEVMPTCDAVHLHCQRLAAAALGESIHA